MRVADRANERTRSMGVAFSGCTVPGQLDPLFTGPPGRMAVGLGIHGEPGISEVPIGTPGELAELLITSIARQQRTAAGSRVAVLVNGLGSTKYEELFVLFGHVSQQLRAAGYELAAPQVGELVTSLDMAGASLTLTWLDEELEQLWLAPAHCPAMHRGRSIETTPAPRFQPTEAAPRSYSGTSAEAQEAGQCVSAVLHTVAAALTDAEGELGRLDAVAGDGDHGARCRAEARRGR
jgi:dihydroxyacetone kinase